ncbi:unnamed protein product [Nesidiocoris tenuis]|uniref:Uncharacterized protein n=1 Tax=Nesidiocoris tenuis TaxID=355587 RepID=A0A6H5GYW0_9HEMI|nr:unnamed protein product [Nesidiocoris tenuis]
MKHHSLEKHENFGAPERHVEARSNSTLTLELSASIPARPALVIYHVRNSLCIGLLARGESQVKGESARETLASSAEGMQGERGTFKL